MDPRNRSLWHLLFATSLGLFLLAVPGSAQQNTQKKAQPKKTEARPASGGPEGHEGDNVRRREEWFYRQRRFPLGHIPAGARQKALDRKEEMRQAQQQADAGRAPAAAEAAAVTPSGSAAAGPLVPSTTTWTHVGPMPALSADTGVGLVSGRVSAIAVDPTNANTVFVGGAQGGVWKSTNGGTNWATTFDGSKSLAIGAIAIDPSNPTTIYVGTGEQNFSGDSYYGAGIYKSIDGGATWNQIPGETILNPQAGAPNSFLPPAAPFNQAVGGVHISSIVVHPDPAHSTKIFAGVQIFENFDGGVSSGIYCSDNAGLTWTQVLHGAIGTDVQVHPANIGTGIGSVAYAALGSPNGDTTIPSPNPSGDTTGQNGVYKSTNANAACTAQVWTLVSKAPVPTLTSAGLIRLGVAPSDAAANTVYAAVGDPSSLDNLAGVFKTIDGGTTWTTVTPPTDFCGHLSPNNDGQCSYDLVVKVHPNDKNTIFLGGSRATSGGLPFFLIASTNGGTTWNAIAGTGVGPTLHVDQHALAFGLTAGTATKMYVGNDGGISSAALPAVGSALTNSSIAWNNLNNGLEMLQFYPGISIHPANNQIAYAGTQDNGLEKMDPTFNPGNTFEWQELDPCGDGGYTAIDPSTPSTVYVACEDINIQKSTANGAANTFNHIDGSITASDRSEFIAPLIIDPGTPQRLYFGTFRVWQTVNGGTTWSAISPDLTSGAANLDDITSLSISPKNPNVVYAGMFGDGTNGTILQRTTNANLGAGATWTRIDANTLPPRAITQVVGDPNNQNVVFVTVSSFSGFMINPPATDTLGHVFKCFAVAPLGCTDISGGLPNIPVNAIVVDPIDPTSNTIYIGTDVGVFGTTTGGAVWIADYPGATNGLPNVAVLGMALHTGSRVLRVVTHGRSAWDLQLTGLAAYGISQISPTTAAAGTVGPFTLTVSGNGFSATSTVLFNNVAQTTNFVSATQLTVNLTTLELATAGIFNVQVSDPAQAPNPILTNTVPFTITTAAPTVTAMAPLTTQVNTAVNLLITGTNFIASSVVRINNNGGTVSDTLTPSSITNNGTTIHVTVPATAQSVQNPGTYFVTVFNPPPGGGDSSADPNNTPPNLTVTPATNTPPPNDNFANAINCAGTGNCDTENTVNATTQNTDPVPSCTVGAPGLVLQGGANSIWYKFTANGPGTIEADTINSLDDTILDVVTGTPGAFTEIACNDDISSGVIRTSQLSFTATQGTTYFFMVASFEGFGGKVIFNLNANIVVPVPALTSINPTGGILGATINNVTFSGTSLSGASISAINGITVSNVVATATQVTATFMIAANAPTGAQNVTVTTPAGTSNAVTFTIAGDFTFGTASPASGTVSAPGMSTQTMIPLAPGAGGQYPGVVNLSCTGLPFEAACLFSPASPIAQNAGAVPVMVTITTRAPSLLPPATNLRPGSRPLGLLLWAVAAFALIALLRLRAEASRPRYAYFAALLVILGGLAMSCGGSGGGGVVHDPGTPAGGPTTITITATSGNVPHSSMYMLTVQ